LATMYNNGLQRCRPFLFVALMHGEFRAIRIMQTHCLCALDSWQNQRLFSL